MHAHLLYDDIVINKEDLLMVCEDWELRQIESQMVGTGGVLRILVPSGGPEEGGLGDHAESVTSGAVADRVGAACMG